MAKRKTAVVSMNTRRIAADGYPHQRDIQVSSSTQKRLIGGRKMRMKVMSKRF